MVFGSEADKRLVFTFNTPLEMLGSAGLGRSRAGDSFQYSVGDAQYACFCLGVLQQCNFQYSVGDASGIASALALSVSATFNTPLEMLR